VSAVIGASVGPRGWAAESHRRATYAADFPVAQWRMPRWSRARFVGSDHRLGTRLQKAAPECSCWSAT